MQKNRLNSYTVVPRYIMSDCRNGKITIPQRNLLLYIRASGDAYGKMVMDMDSVAKEAFNERVTKNYINSILLDLKNKRYIWYMRRTGCRGSFEVHIHDVPMKDGLVKNLDKYFEREAVRGQSKTSAVFKSEANSKHQLINQRSSLPNSGLTKDEWLDRIGKTVRGYDKEREKEKNKESR